jgi:hypothetical protein
MVIGSGMVVALHPQNFANARQVVSRRLRSEVNGKLPHEMVAEHSPPLNKSVIRRVVFGKAADPPHKTVDLQNQVNGIEWVRLRRAHGRVCGRGR